MRLTLTLAATLLAATAAPTIAATTIEAAIMQMENDWAVAGVKKDYAAIERIMAKDWVGQDESNDKHTRAGFITVLKAGDLVITSEKMGPMTVKVVGDVAVVQGSEDEVSSWKGTDTSGKYNYTDVFAKRDGKWQAVASQSSKVKA